MFLTDQCSGLAGLFANLIEKYVSDLDINNMPNVEIRVSTESKVNEIEK